jgi:hypothetical protein
MSKTVKTVLIVVVVVFFMLVFGCGALAYIGSKLPTPAPTLNFPTSVPQVVQPTYTPLPTNTPYPTQNPIPTQKPVIPTQKPIPTEVPVNLSPDMLPGIARVGCPSTLQRPSGIASMECYSVDGTGGLAVSMFDANGKLIIITASFVPSSAYTTGMFFGWVATANNWNVDDVIALINDCSGGFGQNYTEGNLVGRASTDGSSITIAVMLKSAVGGSGL